MNMRTYQVCEMYAARYIGFAEGCRLLGLSPQAFIETLVAMRAIKRHAGAA